MGLSISPDDIAKYLPIFRTLPVWWQLVIVVGFAAVVSFLVGWRIALAYYRERIETQKAFIDEYREKLKGQTPAEVSQQMARNQQDLTELKAELQKVKTSMATPRVTGPPLSQYRIGKSKTISIEDPKGGQVPHMKIVKGLVRPTTESVQVFVRAGPKNDRAWYRQGDVRITAGEWIARCVIGDDKSLTGGEYSLCAIAGAARLPDKFKDFPSDAIVKSEIVTIFLNRNLSDDWTPQVSGKEEAANPNASRQTEKNSLIATLAKHHERGKFFFNLPIKRNEDFESVELSVQAWRREVVASLPEIDAVLFDSPVSAIDTSRLHPDALNRRHEQLKNRILADLAMIEKIMERHRNE